jgi:hypothetical protein
MNRSNEVLHTATFALQAVIGQCSGPNVQQQEPQQGRVCIWQTYISATTPATIATSHTPHI